jgi:hypothetical protein
MHRFRVQALQDPPLYSSTFETVLFYFPVTKERYGVSVGKLDGGNGLNDKEVHRGEVRICQNRGCGL